MDGGRGTVASEAVVPGLQLACERGPGGCSEAQRRTVRGKTVWAEVPREASARRETSGQRAGAYGSGTQWSTFAATAGAERSTWTVVVSFPETYASSLCSSSRPEPASRKSTVTVK